VVEGCSNFTHEQNNLTSVFSLLSIFVIDFIAYTSLGVCDLNQMFTAVN